MSSRNSSTCTPGNIHNNITGTLFVIAKNGGGCPSVEVYFNMATKMNELHYASTCASQKERCIQVTEGWNQKHSIYIKIQTRPN